MDKYRQAIIDLDREEPHDRPKDLELLNEAIEQCENQEKILDILQKKNIHSDLVRKTKDAEDYNWQIGVADVEFILDELTTKEYKILKKWLENQNV